MATAVGVRVRLRGGVVGELVEGLPPGAAEVVVRGTGSTRHRLTRRSAEQGVYRPGFPPQRRGGLPVRWPAHVPRAGAIAAGRVGRLVRWQEHPAR
jgi:hypothetical protein